MWLATDVNIHTNPKIIALADALGLDIDTTVGKIQRLWAWAVQSENESGDVSHLPAKEVAAIMRWNKKPEVLMSSLVGHGFIDVVGDEKFIHDWQELNGKMMSKKRYDRERKFHGNSEENPRN